VAIANMIVPLQATQCPMREASRPAFTAHFRDPIEF
jgi:hypothetical protein